MEHIEDFERWDLMTLIEKASHDETVIYVNVPYYQTSKWLNDNRKDLLQPIDRPISIPEILMMFQFYDFVPFKMELYWVQYLELFLCRTGKFNEQMNRLYGSK
jgi:hypothetical protein